MSVTITQTIDLPGEAGVELVAKTLFMYNRYAGNPPRDAAGWPPRNRSQLMHYWNLAAAVVKAQREATAHGQSGDGNEKT